jgi:CBS domain-containing protein
MEVILIQLCAKDLMVAGVITVPPETPAAELARIFVSRGVSTVAIMDPLGRLLGVVTESDLIRRLADEDEQPRKGWLARLLEASNAGAERYAHRHAATAGELMAKEVITVRPEDTAAHAARLMEEHQIRRVVVADQGRLLGLVSRADLVRAIMVPIGEALQEHSDEDIRRAVLVEMEREPWARHLGTEVEVRNGVVEFSGLYHSEATSRALRLLAENIPGVAQVVDSTVPPPIMFAG